MRGSVMLMLENFDRFVVSLLMPRSAAASGALSSAPTAYGYKSTTAIRSEASEAIGQAPIDTPKTSFAPSARRRTVARVLLRAEEGDRIASEAIGLPTTSVPSVARNLNGVRSVNSKEMGENHLSVYYCKTAIDWVNATRRAKQEI